MKRPPRALGTAAVTTLAVAAVTALGAAEAPDTAAARPTQAKAGTSVTANVPVLRIGSKGPAVTALQYLLTARGHTVAADGVFGHKTADKVKAFQRNNRLTADGVVGAKTWSKLTRTVRQNSSGPTVKAAQRLLTARGHAVAADGVFGKRTAFAVRAFQKSRSLPADAIVGPMTWNALLTSSPAAQPAPRPSAPRGYSLKFTKNHKHPMYSPLSLVRDGKVLKTYRANSGMGSKDTCLPNEGWLPSGTYKVKGHETNRGGWNYNPRVQIQGYAIQLEDKYCSPASGRKPVKRTALFIHSEMLADGTQAINTPKQDDYWRWDGDFDYQSNGCIKLKPNDIKDLFQRLNQAHWPKNLTLRVG
ncbi:peptidoglycan-binding protein [Streptomyces sp. NPDC091412]|uniref:L,D-transpeptidase family protein n=1 Tax=Streptomyces sp. NPDC091412 TaxID=3366002 RepID=UPI0038143B7A